MADAQPVTDQQLLDKFGKLLEDNKKAVQEAATQAVEKKFVDSAILEKQQKTEKDVGDFIKQVADERAKDRTEIERQGKEITSLKQKGSRPPGSTNEPGTGVTIGQQLTESEQYKSAGRWEGRARLSMTLKARIDMRSTPAPTPLANTTPITEGGSGLYIFPRRVAWVTPPQFPMAMRDILDVIPLDGTNAVEYVKETWTAAPDYQVTEGTRKAQSSISWTDATAMVRTIAHFTKVSRQMLADVPSVQSSIDTMLTYTLRYKEDLEILFGDNSAGHLNGIMTQATAYAIPPGLGTMAGATNIDTLAAAALQVANNGFRPTNFVMNPTDWVAMNLLKTTYGSYILGGPASMATPTLWNLPVTTSYHMTSLNYLVGSFPGNAALFDRETLMIEISFENEDDFVNNMATIRCEERVALAVYRPLAFVKGLVVAPAIAGTEEAPPAEKHNKRG